MLFKKNTFKKLTDCPQQDSSKPCDPTHPSIRSFRPTTSCSSQSAEHAKPATAFKQLDASVLKCPRIQHVSQHCSRDDLEVRQETNTWDAVSISISLPLPLPRSPLHR